MPLWDWEVPRVHQLVFFRCAFGSAVKGLKIKTKWTRFSYEIKREREKEREKVKTVGVFSFHVHVVHVVILYAIFCWVRRGGGERGDCCWRSLMIKENSRDKENVLEKLLTHRRDETRHTHTNTCAYFVLFLWVAAGLVIATIRCTALFERVPATVLLNFDVVPGSTPFAGLIWLIWSGRVYLECAIVCCFPCQARSDGSDGSVRWTGLEMRTGDAMLLSLSTCAVLSYFHLETLSITKIEKWEIS